MTQATEIKSLLKILGFALEDGTEATWIKSYPNHNNYKIKVHIDKQSIDYGNKIIVKDKSTSNLKADENLVVLECINRLLEKGYKPKNLHLEETWATGHGTSGRLDILVTRDNGSAYLMIECKTYGVEFDREFKKILKDGGQLFTYFQQDKNANILLLYASQVDKGKIQYRNEIINIEEDYRQTGNVKDFYDRWNKLPKNNGVFDSWVNAYDFQSKALTPKNLKDIKQEDSGFIFNQFLEILRHNVVSDKPNAFNKIFTLFLCKIYDEKATKSTDELAFQWFYTPYTYEKISYPPDDNVSFQKRLTDLYKKGMKEFLDKLVTDISDADFEKKYGKLDSATKKQILDEFTEIRLKKNNEFAIKEVFNDDSFEENAKVVKAVVELLQGFKIRYTKKQQYLSDFFELLLTTGLKQESGQFFTPVPIAQFIIKSIPLDKIVSEKLEQGDKDNLLPTIIDYAAGSGHFITESMHEIQRILDHTDETKYIDSTAKKISSWKTDHFDWANHYIYGIEKDYRLVKVGKVGCYLHGDGLAQIIHSDGLGNFLKTDDYKGFLKKSDKDFPMENKQFDIVISNPPYSVSAFKNNARKYYTEDDFEIYDKLTDQSSEIECLFIERTKQLLKDGGVAGIILPSSILSNIGIYSKAREIILKYFEIVGIAELGSNTFMATGTNTVTLFMRRRNNYDAVNIHDLVTKAIVDKKDITINGIDKSVTKFVIHAWEGLTVKDYFTLFSNSPNENILKSELYLEYQKKIKFKTNDEFLKAIIALEIEKFFYFILAYPQKIVLVKSGEKNEEKEFLGYEFSNRRGSEGIHPIQRGKSIDECTSLFDPEIFNNPEKASTYIYQAFQGDYASPIHPSLEKNIMRIDLVDMLTFDRSDFENSLSLSGKKKLNLDSKWPQVKLENLSNLLLRGKSAKYGGSNIQIIKSGQARGYKEFDFSEKHFVDHNFQLDERKLQRGDILINSSGVGTAGRITLFDLEGNFVVDSHITIFRPDKSKVLPEYVLQCLASLGFKNIESLAMGQSGQIELSITTIQNIKIPVPAIAIQEKIIKEVNALESKEKRAKEQVKKLKEISSKIIMDASGPLTSLSDITSKIGSGATPLGGEGSYKKTGVTLIRSQNVYDNEFYEKGLAFIDTDQASKLDNVIVEKNDILFNITGASVARCCIVDEKFLPARVNQHVAIIRVIGEFLPKYVQMILISDVYKKELLQIGDGATSREAITKAQLENFKIPVPSLSQQKKIVTEIEKFETQIKELELQIFGISQEKQDVLKKYL